MKKKISMFACAAIVALSAVILCSAVPSSSSQGPVSIRTVNFKKCVEGSKFGKQEQASFEALKKQMESVLAEKEKTLNDLANKLEDADYLDSLSPEAETEMKRKFRGLSQEYSQLQSQYLQTLQQTNFKVVQKINEKVAEASSTVGKQNNIDLIINDETVFFTSPNLDLSQEVIAVLDQMYEKEPSEKKTVEVK